MTDASVIDHDIDAGLRHDAPRVRAAFRLTSERHHLDHLLTDLGIEHAVVWQRGEQNGEQAPRRTHGWCLRLPERSTYATDTALTELLALLHPRQEAIVAAIRALELDAHFQLDVAVRAGHLPACYWSAANVRAVAAYGASLHAQLSDA